MAIDDPVANSRFGMASKWLLSRFVDLKKLRYYARNPLEKPIAALVQEVFNESQGRLFRDIIWNGEKTVLFTPAELYNLYWQACRMRDHGGAFAEVGVFRGDSAKMFCEAKRPATDIFLCDMFEGGLPHVGKTDGRFKKGMFSSPEAKLIRRMKNYPNVHVVKGEFPGTAGAMADRKFSFVHLDVDTKESTANCLAFFWPRLLEGGLIISHDYGQCPGVWEAFDEFFADKPVKLLPMADSQISVQKLAA